MTARRTQLGTVRLAASVLIGVLSGAPAADADDLAQRKINPPLHRDRRAYASVVERIRGSKLDYGAAYSPGWKSETRAASAKAEATFFELRSSLLEYMTKMKTLLDDEKAYQALLAMQDCNLASDPAPDCDNKRRSAEAELRAAERRHDLEGFLGLEGPS